MFRFYQFDNLGKSRSQFFIYHYVRITVMGSRHEVDDNELCPVFFRRERHLGGRVNHQGRAAGHKQVTAGCSSLGLGYFSFRQLLPELDNIRLHYTAAFEA